MSITRNLLLACSALVGLSLATITLFAAEAANSADGRSRLVYPEQDGKLVYPSLDEWNNRVPDYSFAGYEGGGASLPMVPVRLELAPGTDGTDDTQRIQAAIDRLSQLPPDEKGLRGALLLKAGIYHVVGPLTIQTGGVVLRGEGQQERGGTVIRCPYGASSPPPGPAMAGRTSCSYLDRSRDGRRFLRRRHDALR